MYTTSVVVMDLEEQDEKMRERIAEMYAEEYSEEAGEAFLTDGRVYVDDSGQLVAPSDATKYLTVFPPSIERPPIPFTIPLVNEPPESGGPWALTNEGGPIAFYVNQKSGDIKGVYTKE